MTPKPGDQMINLISVKRIKLSIFTYCLVEFHQIIINKIRKYFYCITKKYRYKFNLKLMWNSTPNCVLKI